MVGRGGHPAQEKSLNESLKARVSMKDGRAKEGGKATSRSGGGGSNTSIWEEKEVKLRLQISPVT